MLELTFLTSNITKLAHARHLCRDYDIRIVQHKFLHYGKAYEEPRLLNRDKLLELSVKDAIKRWKKHGTNLENRLYFLEDTSVRIDALSDGKKEVPGVDIKYFMQETNFEKLNFELKNKGNVRTVTVFSHVVLILTNELKGKYHNDHIIFSSKATGRITEKEYSFETNILYPWLDNKSFNKWFIPDGYNYPLGMLPIEDAENGDFRKGAINDMISFLNENFKFQEKKREDIPLRIIFQPIFLVSGPTCAGKTTIGKYLLEKLDYYHIEASDFMTQEFLETHGNKSGIELGVFAREILKIKPFIVVERVLSFIRELSDTFSIVITGFRTNDEINYFLQHAPFQSQIKIVYINADYEIRYNRWVLRNRQVDDNQKKNFDRINRLQNEIGLHNISYRDSIYQILNNSSFEEFYKLFEETFLNQNSIKRNLRDFQVSDLRPRNLEEAIYLSLIEDYNSSKQIFFTTTQISHKINSLFLKSRKSIHKDNVSRFFHQRIYPYFETFEKDNKLNIKLSPTGYSKAITLLKSIKSRSFINNLDIPLD